MAAIRWQARRRDEACVTGMVLSFAPLAGRTALPLQRANKGKTYSELERVGAPQTLEHTSSLAGIEVVVSRVAAKFFSHRRKPVVACETCVQPRERRQMHVCRASGARAFTVLSTTG